MKFIVAFFLFFCASMAQAQSKVSVVAVSNDTLGIRLVYEVKEKIRGSKGMQLASESDSGISIRITTLDPQDAFLRTPGKTAYSAVFTTQTIDDQTIFISNVLGICGQDSLSQCAAEIVAKADLYASEIGEAIAKELKKRLSQKGG